MDLDTLFKLLIQLFIKGWEVNLYNEFSIFTILCQNGYKAIKKLYSKVQEVCQQMIFIIVNKVNLMNQNHIICSINESQRHK